MCVPLVALLARAGRGGEGEGGRHEERARETERRRRSRRSLLSEEDGGEAEGGEYASPSALWFVHLTMHLVLVCVCMVCVCVLGGAEGSDSQVHLPTTDSQYDRFVLYTYMSARRCVWVLCVCVCARACV
jgi:hypothetical protein